MDEDSARFVAMQEDFDRQMDEAREEAMEKEDERHSNKADILEKF